MNIRFLFFLFLLPVVVFHGQAQDSGRGYIVEPGDVAPNFEIKLTNGKTLKLSDLKGKVVMLQFTASWCGVCRKEMPHIESEIWQPLKERDDFALIGIDRDEPKQKVIKFAKKVGISYPMGLDDGGKVFEQYAEKGAGITRNVIIDKNGKIIFLTRLYNVEEFNKMKERIFAELDK